MLKRWDKAFLVGNSSSQVWVVLFLGFILPKNYPYSWRKVYLEQGPPLSDFYFKIVTLNFWQLKRFGVKWWWKENQNVQFLFDILPKSLKLVLFFRTRLNSCSRNTWHAALADRDHMQNFCWKLLNAFANGVCTTK